MGGVRSLLIDSRERRGVVVDDRTAELGAPVMTAVPKKSMFGRRWRDSRLDLFADGLAVTAPTEPPRVYRYATTSVLQNFVSVNGLLQEAAYTLIDTDGRALTIGFGNHGVLGRTLKRLGAREVVRGPVFTEVEKWGPEIQSRVTNARFPVDAARIRAGEQLVFGDIAFDATTVTVGRRTAEWASIGRVRAADGLVWFDDLSNRTCLSGVPVHEVPNLYEFLAFADQLRAQPST
jgi:hypothetical protein